MVVRGSVGSYLPVIAGAKLRRVQHDLAKRESAPGSRLVFNGNDGIYQRELAK